MKNNKELELLKSASFEIANLRRQNELMRARLDMFDSINAILHTDVARKQEGFIPDVLAAIDQHLWEVNNPEENNAKAGNGQ